MSDHVLSPSRCCFSLLRRPISRSAAARMKVDTVSLAFSTARIAGTNDAGVRSMMIAGRWLGLGFCLSVTGDVFTWELGSCKYV